MLEVRVTVTDGFILGTRKIPCLHIKCLDEPQRSSEAMRKELMECQRPKIQPC